MVTSRMPNIQGDDFLQTYQLQRALLRARQGDGKADWAKALMQQGASTAPVRSPVEGLARMLSAGVGGYFAGQAGREGEASEQEMMARMIGERDQTRQAETAQLAQAGVPGFSMPMPQPAPGEAIPVPVAPAGGADVVMPPGMPQAPPQPPARPVDAELIAALSGLAGQGNRTAAGVLPGMQFQYQDAQMREREQRQEAAAAAREARMAATANRETFSAPTTLAGPDGRPVLVQIGNRGTVRPIEGYQPPQEAPVGAFAGTSTEAQALNILLNPNADPASPAYAVAFQKLYGPRMVQQQDGTVITMQPQPPQGIRPPVSVGGGNPPPVPVDSPPGSAQAPSTTTQTPAGTVTRTGAGREAPLTESQSKSNMFGLAMTEGNRILDELKEPPSSAVIAAWRNLPEGAFNIALSGDNQRYFNALRQFAAGVLRKETGAAFTANELLDVQSRFFAMPGDAPEMRAQKARARQQAIEAMRAEIPGGFRGQIATPQPPGLAGAQPPGAPVRVTTPAEAAALPSGTPIILPDGTMGRVP
jgi:hypothetical protein